MKISIIIPAYNEEGHIGQLIRYLSQTADPKHVYEILISDGGSNDNTIQEALNTGAEVIRSGKGRGRQMNKAAFKAEGDILYFLHADTYPRPGFTNQIIKAVEEGYPAGCFRLSFDHPHWFLKINAWFTRFNYSRFRFGDQSLFITRSLFQKIGGFNENLIIMEDQEIYTRIMKESPVKVIPEYVTTSGRKYTDNGIYRLQIIFFLIYFLYYWGWSQERLVRLYNKLIHQSKLK